jgi:hypothetical protein
MSKDQGSVSVSRDLYLRLKARADADAAGRSMAELIEVALSVPKPTIETRDGEHRIRIGERTSEWTLYSDIAVLGNYRAATDYFRGTLPTNVVFRIVVVK